MTNDNGEIIEVTVAEWEAARAKQEADLLKEKQEELSKQARSDFKRAGGSVSFGQSKL